MGLCSILQTPDEVLGPELVSGLNGVFLAIIRLLSAIKEQEEEEMVFLILIFYFKFMQ